jgi:integrase
MKAWLYQDSHMLKKHGTEKTSWSVGWIDPAGKRRCKSCGAGERGRKAADRYRQKIQAELLTGTYEAASRQTWQQFRKHLDAKVLNRLSEGPSQTAAKVALKHFETEIKPVRMAAICTATIDEYITRRLKPDPDSGRVLSKATINKELRYIRAALRHAQRRGYIAKVPDIQFLKAPQKLPTYVPPEHFALIYQSCGTAKWPNDVSNIDAEAWWRGLIVMAYMTGWRIGALISLRWQDVDLDAQTALSRAADNKGKRDQLIPLHPLVIEHLAPLEGSFHPCVFPWSFSRRLIWKQFYRIQEAAGVRDSNGDYYGFHDLRRGFATMNAATMDLFTLQRLMQHQSLETTKLYVAMAHRLRPAIEGLYVPQLAVSGA